MNVSITAARLLPADDPLRAYWLHVNLYLIQLTGMLDGYLMAAPALGLPELQLSDFFQLNVRAAATGGCRERARG